MSTFRPKLWTGVSAVVIASTLGLTACGGEGGEQGAADGAPAGSAAPAGEGGEGGAEGGQPAAPVGEGGEGGSEGAGGEAGAQSAYSNVPAGSRDALRLAHLAGFYLAARDQSGAGAAEAAQVLVGQGLLEVYMPSQVEFTRLGLNEATLRRAEQSGSAADIDTALSAITSARERAGGDGAAVTRAMTDLATGLYRETIVDGGVDPIEYQHSRGAALSARTEFTRAVATSPALASARADIDRFVALWPSRDAPEDAARASTVQQVQAQASRLQLALSGA